MKKIFFAIALMMIAMAANAKTLIVYYSYTNNVESIVNELRTQIEADVIEVEPAEKGLDYAGMSVSPFIHSYARRRCRIA